MTNTETLNREVSLGPCPHCHRDLTADAVYVIGAVVGDTLPGGVPTPRVPVGAVANITLAGISITHACGKAERPALRVNPGGVQPGIFTTNATDEPYGQAGRADG